MDALYAMLKTLGADTPKDPAELDKLLRGQTERLKQVLAEQAALKSQDPEIVRLSELAEQAVREGALEAAKKFHEQAKARVGELSNDGRPGRSRHQGAAAGVRRGFRQQRQDLRTLLRLSEGGAGLRQGL